MELEIIKKDIASEFEQYQPDLTHIEMMGVVDSIIQMNYEDYIRSIYYADYPEKWFSLLEETLDEYLSTHNIDIKENDKNIILDIALDIIDTMVIPRSSKWNQGELSFTEISRIKSIIKHVNKKNESLPAQRTIEWYKQRMNVLSASSIWRVLFSEASRKSLIKDKLKDVDFNVKSNPVSYDSPLAWGQRFEPVAQMYYEHTYNTTIKEYGCIVHDTIPFLGASPDGINVDYDKNKSMYGRMLEIKCIVSREIDGIPKKEYWVQMQLQMECCDLNECDFLECKFDVYENETQYKNDGTYSRTINDQQKGMIFAYFDKSKETVMYMYKPFEINTYEAEEDWYQEKLKEIDEHPDYEWLNNVYWYLSKVSCVLVKRNREWFSVVKPEFETVWNEVLKQRSLLTV